MCRRRHKILSRTCTYVQWADERAVNRTKLDNTCRTELKNTVSHKLYSHTHTTRQWCVVASGLQKKNVQYKLQHVIIHYHRVVYVRAFPVFRKKREKMLSREESRLWHAP